MSETRKSLATSQKGNPVIDSSNYTRTIAADGRSDYGMIPGATSTQNTFNTINNPHANNTATTSHGGYSRTGQAPLNVN